jgi:hypothetical protein
MTAVRRLIVLVGYRASRWRGEHNGRPLGPDGIQPGSLGEPGGGFSFRPAIWEQVLVDMQGYWWFGHGYLIDWRVPPYDRLFDHAPGNTWPPCATAAWSG